MTPMGYTVQTMDDEVQKLFAIRDRLMRREAAQLTPRQRLERMEALERQAFDLLRQNPEGWDRFRRRNLKKRAVPRDLSIQG